LIADLVFLMPGIFTPRCRDSTHGGDHCLVKSKRTTEVTCKKLTEDDEEGQLQTWLRRYWVAPKAASLANTL